MADLNFNEIGQVIRVNVGEDLTQADSVAMILLPEFGEIKELTTGVTIPTEDYTQGDETFFVGEYIQYTTVDGDLDYTGRWKKKAKITFTPSNVEQTNYQKFRVLP